MSSLRDRLSRHNDSEDSLIEQFETTLTIRPSTVEYEEEEQQHEIPDLSIDHTILRQDYTRESIVDISELEEHERISEQIPKFKTNRRYSLLPRYNTFGPVLEEESKEQEQEQQTQTHKEEEYKKTPSPGLEEYYNRQKLDPKYHQVLAPSKLIDESLTKYHKTFSDFLTSNPHIKQESPRFKNSQDQTLIILSPYSSEHVFGRKWVSKSYLSTIFERPQRLLASCIGVASAVTMFPFYYKVINSEKRGSMFSSHVRKIHGKDWPKKLFELCLESHDKLQLDQLEVPEDWNTGDIYLNPRTINAVEGVLGTIEHAIDVMYTPKKRQSEDTNHNLVFVVIRPPGHHSHACLPSGFCLLNNVQIGIEYAFETYGVSHCAILDIDLHHGDGSQDICWERAGFQGDYGQEEEDKDNPRDEYGKRFATYPKVGYFSLHDIKSYPTELGYSTKENIKNASTCIMDHDLNIWNVHLQDWNNEEEFYKHYQTKYVQILNRANQFLNSAKKQYDEEYQQYLEQLSKYNKYLFKPHLYTSTGTPPKKPTPPPPFKPLIAISAGFDASEYENPQMQRHGINVPTSFYSKFTQDVVKLAKIHTQGKVISFLEGGYSDGALSTGIFSHLIGLNNDEELLWNHTWGSEQVMRELIKGCKKNWKPYKKPQSDITIWANEVIKLGRSMMPNAILPNNYVYQENSTDVDRVNKMVKEILTTNDQVISNSPLKVDPIDERKVMRHTRSYYKKTRQEEEEEEY
ncbi:Histone deacetylase HOS3 [Spathaspora sp. JA1]|nr:Histone deacetylase HOS3 [Spathaspora sp. JA1]